MLELLRKRRSIRQFEARPVDPATVDLLIEAGLRAPSSRGFNPWEFVIVTDPEMRRRLASAKQHGSGFLADAPLNIVVAADTDKTDVWIEDCSIAAIILQLTGESLGLGSCWAQIRLRPHDAESSAETYVKQLLDLPERFAVECILGFGYPAEAKPGHAASSLLYDQVHRERSTGS